jgi:hypothetical protein
MSSSNILRLLRDAFALNGEKLDLASGDVLSIRPLANDTGSINIGDGTYDMDVKVFLGSSGEYVLFDVGNSQLDIQCPLALTGDLTITGDVSFTETAVAAEHGAGAIGTGVAPATYRRNENGTIITEIKIDLTGLDSSGTTNDVIGLADPGTGAAYIGRNVVATNGVIYRVEVTCLEVPATGDADILFVAGSEADEKFDDTVANTTTLADGTGDWAAGQTVVLNTGVTANYYYYMTQGASDNAAYSAGQFIMRTYGHALLT